MFRHVINDSTHLVSLSRFLNKYCAANEHEITVIPYSAHNHSYVSEATEIFPNIKILEANIVFYPNDIFLMHGIFGTLSESIIYTLLENKLKIVWVIWGGDLIEIAKRNPPPDYLNRLSGMVCAYGEEYMIPSYKGPVFHITKFHEYNTLEGSEMSHEHKKVMIGNSNSPENHHLDIIEKIPSSCFVFLSLAYGGTEEYKQQVIAKALSKYGKDNCLILENAMPAKDYDQLLKDIDVAIFAHHRQQGMGSAITMLKSGKEVYIRRYIQREDGVMRVNPAYLYLMAQGYPGINAYESLNELTFEIKPRHEERIDPSAFFETRYTISQDLHRLHHVLSR